VKRWGQSLSADSPLSQCGSTGQRDRSVIRLLHGGVWKEVEIHITGAVVVIEKEPQGVLE
jgi:hypothetical protein